MTMAMHPRYYITREAEHMIGGAVLNAIEAHILSPPDVVRELLIVAARMYAPGPDDGPLLRGGATAREEIARAALGASERHGLTPLETVRALLVIATQWSAYALRDERHGADPGEKKADEA